ncbi:MAG TPA: MFS transporter, partial [Marmoricola sp.]|nr:MFS transporter [Marmoricola sp.]
ALVLLRLHEIGFGVTGVILAYVGYNAVYAALSYPAGAVSDRLGPHKVIGIGLLVFALAYAGLGATTDHLAAVALIGVYGVFTAFTDGVGKAWVSSILPSDQQGTGQGVFQGLLGVGVLAAGLWAGLAWGADGHLPLLISGTLAAVVGVFVLTFGRRVAVA